MLSYTLNTEISLGFFLLLEADVHSVALKGNESRNPVVAGNGFSQVCRQKRCILPTEPHGLSAVKPSVMQRVA